MAGYGPKVSPIMKLLPPARREPLNAGERWGNGGPRAESGAERRAAEPRQANGAVAKPQNAAEHRATPGGYGGKPPGVAFIGAPTGARNAGYRCPSGGPEHRYACYTEPSCCASRLDESQNSARTQAHRR